MIVQAVVPGIATTKASPMFRTPATTSPTTAEKFDEVMYLYNCEYSLSLEQGQRTTLFFCKLAALLPT